MHGYRQTQLRIKGNSSEEISYFGQENVREKLDFQVLMGILNMRKINLFVI